MTKEQFQKDLQESLMKAFEGKRTSPGTLTEVKQYVSNFVREKLGPPPQPEITITVDGNEINVKVE